MFAKFFAALRSLTAAAEGLAGDLNEARDRFRTAVLDGEQPPAPALPEPAAEPRANGRKPARV